MNKIPAKFLQAVVVLIGMGALAFLLVEPHFEGRNADATVFEIYFKDPFLAYAFVASLSFFTALYQAFKVLGYAGKNQAFSPEAVKALRTMRNAALAMMAFVAGGEIFILLSESDDRAGGVVMGLIIGFAATVMAAAAAMLEGVLQNALGRPAEKASG